MLKSPYSTSPALVEDGDTFCFIVIGRAGHADDWAAYRLALEPHNHSISLTVEEIINLADEQGDKIDEKTAGGLFFALRNSGRYYRD